MFDFDLAMFGFVALWSPIFFMILLFVTIVYLYIVRRDNKIKKKLAFVTGMSLLYIFLGSPIDLLGHLIFSLHMIQMAGIYFIAIPFIVYGLGVIIEKSRVIKYLDNIHPFISLGFFNILFSMYHLPIVFDYVMTHNTAHIIVHGLLILTCIFMWYPLIYTSMNSIKKIGYIFANGVLLTPACALIIFSDKILYGIYTDPEQWASMMRLCLSPEIFESLDLSGPYFFHWIPVIEDQQLGGVLMKIVQEIVLGSFIGFVFYTGFSQDRKIDRIEDVRISSR